MTPELKHVEQQALQLSSTDRETLVERLLNSLRGDVAPEVERAWILEAERRYLEYREGRVEGISGDRIFQDIQRELGWQN